MIVAPEMNRHVHKTWLTMDYRRSILEGRSDTRVACWTTNRIENGEKSATQSSNDTAMV